MREKEMEEEFKAFCLKYGLIVCSVVYLQTADGKPAAEYKGTAYAIGGMESDTLGTLSTEGKSGYMQLCFAALQDWLKEENVY